MDVTTLSTKGQIVIPEKMRRGYEPGSAFSVSKVEDLIILKPVKGLSVKERQEMKEINRIWDDIDKGNAEAYDEKEFFSAMKKW
ncbi:MAG: AbrB/MazE/SpoVT family DNA-binding domain-containing protein [archaeon]